MKAFAASVLAGAATAVRINQGEYTHPWSEDARPGANVVILGNLQAKVDEKIADGDICIACGDDFDLPKEALDIGPVKDELGQIASVLEQIEVGFGAIADYNEEVEEVQLEDAQEEQQEEIEEIMEEAEEEAAEIIEEESDEEEAAEEVEEVLEDAADDIIEVNEDHDKDVADAAKTAFVAEITNEAIKDTIVGDVLAAVKDGEDLADAVEEQHLPFDVQLPEIDELAAELEVKTEDIQAIKRDPKFDQFLESVLSNFAGLRDTPDIVDPERYYKEEDFRPQAVERPSRPEYAQGEFYRSAAEEARPQTPSVPEQLEPVNIHLDSRGTGKFRGDVIGDQVFIDQVDRFDRSGAGFRQQVSYRPEFGGPGDFGQINIDAERIAAREAAAYDRYSVPQQDFSVGKRGALAVEAQAGLY